MPAAKKDPSVRRRTNATTTRATLTKPVRPKVPPLPKLPDDVKWHPQVVEWWKATWTSEMREQWAAADLHLLYLAAKLQQTFWNPATEVKDMKAIAGELRLIFAHFGLSPMARKSLEWELPKDEPKTTPAPRKRAAKKVAPPADPRARFRVVS